MSEKAEKVDLRWERFQKTVAGMEGRTSKKVPRKDELGETWNIFQGIQDGRVVWEVREDRV